MSKDLVHWCAWLSSKKRHTSCLLFARRTRLPPPVRPNATDPKQWYDHSGSYDGGVTLLPLVQGGPTIVYDVIECKINCTKRPKMQGCKCAPGTDPNTTLGVDSPMDQPWMGIARAFLFHNFLPQVIGLSAAGAAALESILSQPSNTVCEGATCENTYETNALAV